MTNTYLDGTTLHGDDFAFEQIKCWYEEEKEAYANLGSENIANYRYGYHELNKIHGFNYLKARHFENVLGLGAAWGHEFYPIIKQITNLHIIEPSDKLRSESIAGIKPVYKVPAISGLIDYPDNHFDLVTCFGTLHHIPNVSYVIAELYRVTKPGGIILLREPIISMGDWTKPRAGLTRNERGIPLHLFREIVNKHQLQIIQEGLCFTMTAFIQRRWIRFSKRPVYTFKTYIIFDKWLSKLFARNLTYHARHMLKRIAPQSVAYVLKKV
ncbi:MULTISPECIES: methyltransferase domain-containing protein [unclassified Mucilaginibacter]|uniref:class I SAM-dependent methyltransferase n=1 Tax=unclassified Mucilaginibacter TaxID=2617802 RepID=UPI002AC8BE5D|nr:MULTISPECIES: methyltransferase domain-containing protein [unclassified Mucilaginibacter]MEB0261925.1 methyltransferase domain-containing protein [Mucilaginibacter sp. 10I4]MEB0277654.1 methyltransferase domain-containing protein [Mucilaginibacter sp. 10B2]MEB0299569.1 methyltransferase domain-containing protein [Mucilaginibacter sp. 5C4]WPX24718.1 methyltransferase domain-containing protein [Mucilaginibacter sp. 5C4]